MSAFDRGVLITHSTSLSIATSDHTDLSCISILAIPNQNHIVRPNLFFNSLHESKGQQILFFLLLGSLFSIVLICGLPDTLLIIRKESITSLTLSKWLNAQNTDFDESIYTQIILKYDPYISFSTKSLHLKCLCTLTYNLILLNSKSYSIEIKDLLSLDRDSWLIEWA